MKNNNKKLHKIASAVEIDLITGEKKVLEYVYLTDEELNRFYEPFAKMLIESMRKDIESGKFDPNEITQNQMK